MVTGRHALVIGGSMSGLLTAVALTRRGWQVDLFERVAGPLVGRGAGIVAQPELKTVLRSLAIEADHDLGVEVATRVMFAQDGQVTHRLPLPQTMTAWDRVLFLIKAAFPAERYHSGRELLQVEQGRKVVARFQDGTIAEGDVLIGGDGIRSTVRQQYLPDVIPRYAGYTAWRGLVNESDFLPDLHRELYDVFGFCLPDNEQMLGYPVAGADNDLRPGHRRYNFVWYRPASEEAGLPRLLTDDTGRRHMISIPPPLIARAVIAEMRAAAERVLAPQFRRMVAICAQPFLQPIYDLEVPRMAFGRVAVLGDAAFVARPHIGAGVAKAADDAIALADALDAESDIEAALARFSAARQPVGHRIVERTRALGAYVQADIRTDAEREYAARHRTPQAVLSETALMDY